MYANRFFSRKFWGRRFWARGIVNPGPGAGYFPKTFWPVRFFCRRFWPKKRGNILPPGKPAARWIGQPAGPQYGFAGTVYKRASDRLWFIFDFGNMPEVVVSGATIFSSSITGPTVGPSIDSSAIDGDTVGAWFSGGSVGLYDITCTTTFSNGSHVSVVGKLSVTP